ncbi:MAG: transglutaminase domain-containing protein [Candidatus Saccharimonadales bacterium]
MGLLKRKHFITLFLLLAIILAPVYGVRAASSHSFNVSADYDVAVNGKVVVTQNYTVTNNTTDSLDSLSVVTPGKKITTINARYSDGTTIKTSTKEANAKAGDIEFSYQSVELNFTKQIRGTGQSWQFTLSYVVEDAVTTFGNARSLFLPGIGQEVPDASYKLTLRFPKEFGSLHLLPKPERSGIESGKLFFTFNRKDLPAQALATIFGNEANYKVGIEVPLKNNLPWYRTFKVALPPELASQQVALAKFEPQPANTSLDADGNLYALYKLRPFQKVNAKVTLDVQVARQRYDYTKSQFVSDIPDEFRKYTSDTEVWPRTEVLYQKSASIADPKLPVGDIVKALSKYVAENLKPKQEPFNFAGRQSGEYILNTGGQANALGYADALIALLRNQDIPARLVLGQASTQGLSANSNIHAWVESYVPGVGWVVVDPFWAEKFYSHETSYIDHVALNIFGANDSALSGSTPLLVPGAQIAVVSGTDFKRPESELSVFGKRYVILPGLALQSLKASQKAGNVIDNLEIKISNGVLSLGSLAPNETKTLRLFSVGSAALQPANVVLAVNESSLAEGNINVVWWPFIAIISVLLGLLIVIQWRRFRRRKNPPVASPETENKNLQNPLNNGEQTDETEDAHSADHYHE